MRTRLTHSTKKTDYNLWSIPPSAQRRQNKQIERGFENENGRNHDDGANERVAIHDASSTV